MAAMHLLKKSLQVLFLFLSLSFFSCLVLAAHMITVGGIEKVLPRFHDLEVMLQVLARP